MKTVRPPLRRQMAVVCRGILVRFCAASPPCFCLSMACRCFWVNRPCPLDSTQVSPLAVGSNPASLALADFNGDGKQDLAVANSGSNNLSVFFGNGDGTFQTQATYSTGNQPLSVTAADYNGDGKVDLATANALDGTVSVLLNNGKGTFPTGATGTGYAVYAVGSSPASIASGNFSGGTSPDLAVADENANEVTSLLNNNNGTGTFGPQTNSGSGGGAPDAVVMADFNGDGTPDLAVVNNATANGEVLQGPTYSSTNPQAFSTGMNPVALAAGDFNNDGKQDLAIVNQGDNPPTVSILLQNADGTFCSSCPAPLTTASDPTAIAIGDFNLDGKLDLAVTIGSGGGAAANSVSVFLGNGDGTFGVGGSFGSGGANPSAVAVAAFRGDGKLDLAITNQNSNTVAVLLGNGDGTFGVPAIYSVGLLPSAVAAGYLSGQTSQPDLVIANYCGNLSNSTTCSLGNPIAEGTVTVLLNNRNGTGTFLPGVTYTVGPGPTSIALGNYNPSDTFFDVAVAESGTARRAISASLLGANSP